MTIHELLALTGLTESDEIPVWDAEASSEPTKKITAQNFASSIKTLASLLGTGDVVNDLTSTSTTAPLSANMGTQLNNNKPNKYLPSDLSDANDYSLFGNYFFKDTNVSNLPTSDNGFYYVLFAYGLFQVAFLHNESGISKVYTRNYTNNQWYPWALCGGRTTKNGITGAASGVTTNGYYIYSRSTGTVRIYLTADSSSDISTSTVLGVIPTGYRPSATTKLPGTITTANGSTHSYYGEVATNGNITQKLSSSARSVVLFGEYEI